VREFPETRPGCSMSQRNTDQPIRPPPSPPFPQTSFSPKLPSHLHHLEPHTLKMPPSKTSENTSSYSISVSSSSHYSRVLSLTQSHSRTTSPNSIQPFEYQPKHSAESPPAQIEHDVKDQVNEEKKVKPVTGQNSRLLTASQSRLCIKRYISEVTILNILTFASGC